MNGHTGAYLEVIAGPMYSGKTEELIRQIKRAIIGGKRVQVFKPTIDTRYGTEEKLYSHAGLTAESAKITHPSQILEKLDPKTNLVIIDEAQHMGKDLLPVVDTLLSKKKWVVVGGLGMTFDRQPFVPMPELMAMADKVTKLSAICSKCGADAVYHKPVKKVKSVNALEPDPEFVKSLASNTYEARCRKCFGKK